MQIKKTSLLILTFLAAVTAAAESYSPNSVLSDGRWIKIKVTDTGVQRISHEMLRSWGFTNPERVAVYGYGSVEASMQLATAPDDIPPTPSCHTEGALYFYGESDLRVRPTSQKGIASYRNYYSYGSHYFLTEERPAAGITASPAESDSDYPVATTHTALKYYEPEEYNPVKGGALWYGSPVKNENMATVTFQIEDYAADGYVGYTAVGKNPVNSFVPLLQASGASLSGQGSSTIIKSSDGKEYYTAITQPNVVRFTPDGDTVDFSLGIPAAERANTSFLSLDAMWVLYSRHNRMPSDGTPLEMHLTNSATLEIDYSATGRVPVIWDVTAPLATARLQGDANSDSKLTVKVSVDSKTPHTLVAFDPASSQIATPTYEGVASNSNLHAMRGYDMVILTSPDMIPAAERIAAVHSLKQGLNVAVVDKAEVFNEFSSGSFTANSIRRFAAMLHSRDGRLKYMLLLGGANYDNRSVASDAGAYLPSYQMESVSNARNVAKALTCDMYFGMIDADLAPDLVTRTEPSTPREITVAVGRIPALVAGEAELMATKIERYMDDPSRAGNINRALVMADYGNSNQHTHSAESHASILGTHFPEMTLMKAYQEAFEKKSGEKANSTLSRFTRKAFAIGPAYVFYAGHGSSDNIFSDSFFNYNYISSLEHSSNPIVFMASCFPYSFDYTDRGLLTGMLIASDGPIAVTAPAREVYMTSNVYIADLFAEKLAECAEGATVGDVLRAALNDVLYNSMHIRTNALSYNLGGDPALPVGHHTYQAVITSDISGKGFVPGVPMTLSGEIRRTDGSVVTDFDGTITLELFDAPQTMESLTNSADDAEGRCELTLDHTLVATASAEVKGGRWTAQLTAPAVAETNKHNRLSLTATPSDGFDFASGMATVSIADIDPAASGADTTAPLITLSIENSVESLGAVETDRNPLLAVTVSDDISGICFSDAAVGGRLRVILDGSTNLSSISSLLKATSETSYSAVTRLPSLSNGRHTIEATVSDNAGNTTTETLEFIVAEAAMDGSLTMTSDVVSTEATFTVSHNLTSSPEMRLIIEDLAGNTLLSRPMTSPTFTWDLRDAAGNPIPDGHYTAYTVIKSHPRYGSTPRLRFTVIR